MTLAWDLFRHYLLSRRAGALIRTVAWLCMVGVALGVLSLVVVMSVMNGFNESIRRRLFAAEPHLTVQIPGLKSIDELERQPLVSELRKRGGILRADSFESQDVILRTGDGTFGGAVARGMDAGALEYLLQETAKANRTGKVNISPYDAPPVSADAAHLKDGEVLIGIDLARGMGILEGDSITIVAPEALLLPEGETPPFVKERVKGLISTNISDIDAKTIFYGRQGVAFAAFRNSASREVGLEIRLPDPEKFQETKSWLEARGAKVQSWVDRNSTLFYALKLEKLAIGTFLALSALIASFSIVTVLYLLTTQKRKDIGLLMSLGLSPKRTRMLFVQVGLLLSAIGIGTGLILGVGLCILIDNNPLPILPDIYVDATIPAHVDPVFVVLILIVSSIIALFSAWIPARALTRETPSDALRSQRQIHGAHR